jgi:hypothetical protein
MRIIRNRAIAAATAAAIALTSVGFAPAMAAAPVSKKQPEASQSTDFSAQRRHRRGYSRGNAAAGAAILGIIGAVGTYAAAREYRKAQERRYYNGGYYRHHYGHPGYGPAPYGYYRY